MVRVKTQRNYDGITSSRKGRTIFVVFSFISILTFYLKIALGLMQISTISLYYIHNFFRMFISANRAFTPLEYTEKES